MKKIILLIGILSILILIGCTNTNSQYNYKCQCLRINLDNYIGSYLFYDDVKIIGRIGITENSQTFAIPPKTEIKVCQNINDDSGECENEIFRFRLEGQC